MQLGFLTTLTTLSPIFAIIGMLIVIISVFKWMMDRQRGDRYASFPVAALIAGVFIGGTPIVMPLILNTFLGVLGEEPTAAPTEEPTSTPSATPSAEPTSEPAQPIDFGTIENIGTLWFILAAVVVALAVAVMAFFGFRAGRKAKARRDEEKAILAEFAERWDAVKELHQKMLRKITHAETDWDTLFSMPSLSDITVPQTKALYEAFRAAGDVSDAMPRTPVDDIASLAYPKAVYAFRDAWNVAEVAARKIGQSGLTREERKTISEIKNLLALAESSSAAPAEREVAYRRIQTLVKTLTHIALPKAAMDAIESGLTSVRAIEAPVEAEKVIAL